MSITLKLKNFRCHHQLSTAFDEGVILVDGQSGAGKSSMFDAILWCLYGAKRSGNVKAMSVAPHGSGAKTVVTMTIDDIVVERQTKPNKVTVILSDSTMLEGDVAQAFINKRYGDKDVFVACCYVPQGLRNVLLRGSNMERLDILSKIAFNGDRVQDKLDKIAARLAEVSKVYDEISPVFKNKNQELKEKIEIVGKDVISQHKNEVSRLEELEDSHRQASASLSSLRASYDNYLRMSTVMDEIRREIDAVNARLEAFEASGEDVNALNRLVSLRRELDSLPTHYSLESIDELQKRLSSALRHEELKGRIKDDVIDENEVKEAEEYIIELRPYYDAAIRLKSMTKPSVQNVEQLTQALEKQKLLTELKATGLTLSQVSEALELLPAVHDETNRRYRRWIEVKKELETLSHLPKRSTEQRVLQCPCCRKSLVEIDGSLMEASALQRAENLREEFNSLGDFESFDVRLLKWKESQRDFLPLLEKIRDVDLTSVPVVTESMKDYFDTLSRLNGNDAEEIIASYREALTIAKKRPYVEEQARLRSELASLIADNPSELRMQIRTQTVLHQQHDRYRELTSLNLPTVEELNIRIQQQMAVEELKRTKMQLVSRLQSISVDVDSKEKYDQAVSLVEDLNVRLPSIRKVKEIMNLRQEVMEHQKRYVDAEKQRSALLRLKSYSVQAYNRILLGTMDEINNSMANVLEYMFDDPIVVRFAFTDGSRSSLTLNIHYKGHECDINDLSGGEADRVSLALTIALARMSDSPIVLLDETVSSLDATTKDVCIKSIRYSLADKVCLVVSHDTVSGLFDGVMKL